MNAVLPRMSRLSRPIPFRVVLERLNRSSLPVPRRSDLALAALVGLVVIAFFPPASVPRWTPRATLYLAVLPWGLLGLAQLVRRRDRAAIAATTFLGVATLSALLANGPLRSLLPVYYRHGSVAAWAAALGVWALAQQGSALRRRLIQWAFIAAVGLSVSVGVLQLGMNIRGGPLELVGNRASGLSHNPVYLGALTAGAVAWCVHAMLTRHEFSFSPRTMRAALAVSTLGLWIAGTRVAFLVVVVVFVLALVRAPGHTLRSIAPWAAVGVVAGEAIRMANRLFFHGAGVAATNRLGGSQVASGFGVRFEVWEFNLSAIARRPLLGHGPGQHANAVQPHLTPEFAARTRPELFGNNWNDAHNIVVEFAVTVGVIGVIAALAFAILQRGTIGGPAAWAAIAIAATWLMQPVSFVTMIPALALLGAARTPASPRSGADDAHEVQLSEGLVEAAPPARRSRGPVVAAAVGTLLAGWLIVADVALVGARDRSLAGGERIAAWWFHDPLSAWEGSVLALREGLQSDDPDERERVLDLARGMTDRDPGFSFWWVQRGDFERIMGLDDEAWASYRRALEIQPWNRTAMVSILEYETDVSVRADIEQRMRTLDRLRAERKAGRGPVDLGGDRFQIR